MADQFDELLQGASRAAPQQSAPSGPSPDEQFAALLDQASRVKPAARSPVPARRFGPRDLLGPDEVAINLGTGTLAGVAGGLAGLIDWPLYGWLGLTKMRPDKLTERIENAYTYQPRTTAGQLLQSGISYPFNKLAQGATAVGDKIERGVLRATGSPVLAGTAGGLTSAGIQSIPMIFGSRVLPKGAPVKAPTVDPAIAAGSRIGLSFTPGQTPGSSFLARSLESLSGAAKLERAVSRKNAPVVDARAAAQIGLPQGTQLTPASIAAAKAPWNAVYAKAARTGEVDLSGLDPTLKPFIAEARRALRLPESDLASLDAQDLINTVRQLRAQGFANQSAPRYMPAQKLLGKNQVQAAQALDEALGAHVKALGSAGLVPQDLFDRLMTARRKLAQIATVERSLRSGHVVPKLLARQAERGAPLSGDLKTIADAYGVADRSLQNVNRIRDAGPFSVLDYLAGAEGLNPGMHALMGAVLGRPLLRGFLASRPFQRRAIAPKPISPRFPALERSRPLLPLMGLQAQQSGVPAP